MSTLSDVVEALNSIESKEKRGYQFEELMVRYFQLDPVLAAEYDQVVPWNDWEYNGGRADSGIDIVARSREDHTWTAIQCKYYAPTTYLQKSDIDSFFTESGKSFRTDHGTEEFHNRVIISTTEKWSKKALEAVEDQTIPVQLIGLGAIADSPINWDIAYPGSDYGAFTVDLQLRPKYAPRPHQREAIDQVLGKFQAHDRGKLIMACGTGKTFTALRLAEEYAEQRGGKARVLFAVPSISLLGQSLREWSANATMELRAFAVCSDKKVSKEAEDIRAYEVGIPVTTDGAVLAEQLSHRRRAQGLTVVFTTYQSLQAVHEAQATHGADDFDLIICDEAHRTTGITLPGEAPSAFTAIHDAAYVRGAKRLYMTATPRLYDEKVKDKATDHSAELASMDDEALFGPDFHRLGFGEAVEKGLLTDYKVLVIGVDEAVAAEAAQRSATTADGEITLDTASKLIGCWTALAKRSGDTGGFAPDAPPMRRAVAFAQNIKASENLVEIAPSIIDSYTATLHEKAATADIDEHNLDLTLAVEHVDGTMNAQQRSAKLTWLKAPVPADECRILSNARCLSEGVDVPALDAVLFLHPRNSVVDVVQSVGRVMRKSEGKDYGYIILPVAIPAGVSPSQALSDNKRFKVVWQVLNALRAHDERFNAIVNSATLNTKDSAADKALEDRVRANFVGESNFDASDSSEATKQLALFSLTEWQEAMYTRIVDKVGDREYWEDWAADVAEIAQAQIARINALLDAASPSLLAEFDRFLEGLRANLNDSITRDEAISMLSQHLITAPVFDALFADSNFAAHNPVSRVMQRMVDALDDKKLDDETASLEKFYRSVQVRASEVTSAEGKQTVIKDLYERFFRKAFRKQSDALGIVYTPVQIVDFILRAADEVSREHFGRGLTDAGVHILDPFTGTGTFMVRLLQSGLITPADLARKYASELHATEIMLLAYYVAAVNIETTYHALVTERARMRGGATSEPAYKPFEGIVLADTFQITEADGTLDLDVFKQNNERIQDQLKAQINVIVGNPPYSVGQASANDNNANLKYPTLDRRIEVTFAAKSTAQLKNSLYDSYLRAFRWSIDRLGAQGIMAFVANNGWVDGNTADGVRLTLAEELSDIYVYNLRGNQRTAGEQSRREGGKVFGSGSRAGIAIILGVKREAAEGVTIHYRDIGDYLTAEEKLAILDRSTIANTDWQPIEPNKYGDWLGQRNEEFETWPVLGSKKKSDLPVFFASHANGVGTSRDAWCYAPSTSQLKSNVNLLIQTYEHARSEFLEWSAVNGHTKKGEPAANSFLQARPQFTDPKTISWSRSLKNSLAKNDPIVYVPSSLTRSVYRPFFPEYLYFNRQLNENYGQPATMFPTPKHDNIGFYVVNPGSSKPFSALATDLLPDLALYGSNAGQFFPRWTWEPVTVPDGELDFGLTAASAGKGQEGEIRDGYRRVDNITDEILRLYRDALGGDVSKDDIFYFVYGQLHDPGYREAYATDLKKMLPHIQTPNDRARFDQLAAAGRELMALHVGYEDVEPWPVTVEVKPTADPDDRETWRVAKMKWAKKGDTTTLVYNTKVTIRDIPADAERYQLGARSALAWLIDRYQVKTDKPSGIVNDPNDWADEEHNPRYIVDLVAKVTRVAMETVRIVDGLAQ